ncbi:AI-2E family transporter [Leptodesmis sp.]|uniref:AI-2E family transporter n=1 Tax=Leptodesmis sp. TaxID=3100501 RepID=UPI0040534A3B
MTGPIVALNVWLLTQLFRFFEGLITVLVMAAILAFLLNYPVRLFQRATLSRVQAVTLVLVVTVALFVIAGVTLVPIIVDQTAQLLAKIPDWLQTSARNLQTLDLWAKQHNLPLDLQGFSGRINNQIERQLEVVAKEAVGVAVGTVNGLITTILVFVLAFYMLLYGHQLWNGLINLLPPRYGIPFRESLWLNFHNFFISQILLAVFMGLALIPVFLVLQVPFALLFALLIGIAELIPLVGAALGIGVVTILLMLQNFWMGFWVVIAATILQQIRDNVLGPKMLGDFTGLNPIWIFIALLMGLQMAGFLGVIIAVPIAGTIKGTLEAVRSERLALELKKAEEEII